MMPLFRLVSFSHGGTRINKDILSFWCGVPSVVVWQHFHVVRQNFEAIFIYVENPQKCMCSYVQCCNPFFSKLERTSWSLIPQLDTVIIEVSSVKELSLRGNTLRLYICHYPSTPDTRMRTTMMLSLWASWFSRICTKCAASFTKELVSPASGEITFVNMRASSYVGTWIDCANYRSEWDVIFVYFGDPVQVGRWAVLWS